MSRTGSLTGSRIDRVRVRAPAGTTPADWAWRMRQGLTQWLDQAEAACHTLSPDAIVVLRQVRAPWQALKHGGQALGAPQAVTHSPLTAISLRSALQGAQHGLPGLGATVGAGCPAVWFDNEAEVLAGLAQDALRGTLAQRWWWRPLLGQAVHDEVVQRHWVGTPQHVPQALSILQTEQQGSQDTAWLRHMGAASREALLQALASVFPCDAEVLSWVRTGGLGTHGARPAAQHLAASPTGEAGLASSADDGAMRLSRLCTVLRQRPHDAADGRTFLAKHTAAARHLPVNDSAQLNKAPEHVHRSRRTHGPQVLSGANAHHAPPARTTPHADTLPASATHTALDGPAHTPSQGQPPAPAHLGHDTAPPSPTQPAGAHAPRPPAMPSTSTSAGDADMPTRVPQASAPAPGHATRTGPGPDTVAAPPTPTSAHDTAALATPHGQASPHAAPAPSRHTGHTPQPGPATVTAALPSPRLDTAHAGLFFLLNAALGMGWYGDFTQPQHRGLCMGLGLDLSPWQFLRAAGQALAGPAWHQDPLAAWLLAMDPTPLPRTGVRPLWAPLRARLSLALGLPRLQATRLTVHLPGQVRLRPGRVDVHIPLAQLPLAVRLAGLDRDIGWLPAAGLDIRFHFEVGAP